MSADEPSYYTREGLAHRAGISKSTLKRHEAANVAGIKAAREVIGGLGLLYNASKARRYLAAVGTKHKATQ